MRRDPGGWHAERSAEIVPPLPPCDKRNLWGLDSIAICSVSHCFPSQHGIWLGAVKTIMRARDAEVNIRT